MKIAKKFYPKANALFRPTSRSKGVGLHSVSRVFFLFFFLVSPSQDMEGHFQVHTLLEFRGFSGEHRPKGQGVKAKSYERISTIFKNVTC